jgi:hypothetical protein
VLVAEQVQRTVAIRDGRTSTETVRRTELDEEGEHRVIAEEFAVLDRAGRLQLPRAHVEALELRNRVRLRLEEDHVGVWPDRSAATRASAPEAAAQDSTAQPRGAAPVAPDAQPLAAAPPPAAQPADQQPQEPDR